MQPVSFNPLSAQLLIHTQAPQGSLELFCGADLLLQKNLKIGFATENKYTTNGLSICGIGFARLDKIKWPCKVAR